MKRVFIDFLCLALLALMPVRAFAEGAEMRMVVHIDGAEDVVFSLSSQVRMSYSDETNVLTIASGDNTCAVEIERVSLCEILGNAADAITDTKADDAKAKIAISFDGVTLGIRDAAPGDEAACYDMSGKKLHGTRIDDSGCATIGMAGVPTGVYVVKVGKVSMKIRKGGVR